MHIVQRVRERLAATQRPHAGSSALSARGGTTVHALVCSTKKLPPAPSPVQRVIAKESDRPFYCHRMVMTFLIFRSNSTATHARPHALHSLHDYYSGTTA